MWRARSDSGEWGCWVGVRVGWGLGERAKKNFITLWLLLKLRISGGSEFCFKIYVEREILRERGCGLGLEG